MAANPRDAASAEELQSLTDHFNNEFDRMEASDEELYYLGKHFKDMGFPHYRLLNGDCKLHIMECMDLQLLVQIRKCSKIERGLAATFPLKIAYIGICQMECRIKKKLHIREEVSFKLGNGDEYEIYFVQSRNRVVARDDKRRLHWKRPKSKCYKEAVALFEQLLELCHYRVENITLDIGKKALEWASREDSPVKQLPSVRTVRLGKMDAAHQQLWLKKMPNNMESLRIDDFPSYGLVATRRVYTNVVTSEVVDLPQVRTARKLTVHGQCDITDAQLLELNSVDTHMWRTPNITARGVNAFFKRWWQCGGDLGNFKTDGMRFEQNDDRVRLEDVIDGIDVLEIEASPPTYVTCTISNKVRPTELLEFTILGRDTLFAGLRK